jgi:hypothetical protein
MLQPVSKIFQSNKLYQRTQRYIPWEPKKLSSEVGPPQLMEGKVIEKLTRLTLKISTHSRKVGGPPLKTINLHFKR